MTHRIIAVHRKARFEYEILEKEEAGLVLLGSEVKSLRLGKSSIVESYVAERGGALYLLHANIAEYKSANQFNHEPKRPRKLLLHKKRIRQWTGKIKLKGLSIVPLSLYFNSKGLVKCEIALVRGKQLHDKRESIKRREADRSMQRMLKHKE